MVDMSRMDKTILLEDRSGAELDDKCGQAYFWNRLHGGKGIVPKEEQLPLLVGALSHEDMALAAQMEDISEGAVRAVVRGILERLTDEDRLQVNKMELLYRRLGWFIAWCLFLEPTVRERYDTINVEDEIVLGRDPLWVSVTPDRIVRAKSDHHLEYWEYKTTITASTNWQMSWVYKIQMHLGLKGASEEINEEVKFGQVIGLMKGRYDKGRLNHPYVWAWRNVNTQKWSCTYEPGNAWERIPAWEYFGGIVDWVKFCGEEVARDQFPMSPPVFLNESMLEDWILRRTRRQERITTAKKVVDGQVRQGVWPANLLTNMFPKMQNQCRPAFGDQCPYLRCCWNAQVGADPIGSGYYVPRQPHHELEIIGVEI